MYRERKYLEIPDGISREAFIKMVRKWFRLEELHSPEVLNPKEHWKEWSADEKLFMVEQVIAGNPIESTAINNGISEETFYQ